MSNTAFAELEQEAVREAEPTTSRNRLHPTPATTVGSPMFVDCLLEPALWQLRQRRWTAITSLTLQCIGLGIAVLIPLMFTDVLPTQQLVTFLVAAPPPPPPPPPPAIASAPVKQFVAEIVSGHLTAPTKIPDKVRMIKEDEAPPAPTGFGVVGGVPGGVAGGQLGGVLGGIIGSTTSAHTIVVAAPAPIKRLRISQGVSAGMIINRVVPEYPKIAKIARIQGTVQLDAWITKDGSIERLKVVSGNPMLINAAVEAVKQWRYKPYMLNGEPVEVETTVEVNFFLDQPGS